MQSIKIIDGVFAPYERIVLNFKGYEPVKVCGMIRSTFESILQVETKDMFERLFKWDITDDPRSFYNFWTVNKELDKWSTFVVKVVIQGEQHTKTKMGKIRIEFYGYIETEYNYANFLQRALWLLYNRIFYYKERRMYIERGKEWLFKLRERIMSAIKMPKAP